MGQKLLVDLMGKPMQAMARAWRFLLPWPLCYFRCLIMAFRPLTAAPAVLLREAKPLKAILGHAKRLASATPAGKPAATGRANIAMWRREANCC
jgi:hypothetical protein